MELTIPEFVFAILACCGGGVILMSLISRSLHARAEARSLRDRVICRMCLHAYMDDQHMPPGRVLECPNCGAANEKGG